MTDGERLAALEVEMRHMRAEFRETKDKVSEMHDLLMQARGFRWFIVGVAAIAGFVSAKASVIVPWLPK